MKVKGTVVINLTRVRLAGDDAASTARAAIWTALSDTPPGADVRLIVPRWDWWAPFAAAAVLEQGDDLGSITVESDAATVRQWVLELRRSGRRLHAVGDS